jgi:hypothetical protein
VERATGCAPGRTWPGVMKPVMHSRQKQCMHCGDVSGSTSSPQQMSHARHAARRFADRRTMSSTPLASCICCGSVAAIAALYSGLPPLLDRFQGPGKRHHCGSGNHTGPRQCQCSQALLIPLEPPSDQSASLHWFTCITQGVRAEVPMLRRHMHRRQHCAD